MTGIQDQEIVLKKAAYNMGIKVTEQKYRFCDKHPDGTAKFKEVLHIIDLSTYIFVNSHSLYKNSFMKRVRDKRYHGKRIKFLTD